MSEDQIEDAEKRKRPRSEKVLRIFAWVFLLLVGAVLGLILLGSVVTPMGLVLVETVWHLATGWFQFLKINLKEVDWEWQRIATGVGMIGVAVAAGHAFARWWMRRIEGGVTWKAKWTVCAAMMMGLFAISAISVAGIAHQVAWLRGERLVFDRSMASQMKRVNDLRQLCYLTRLFADDHEGRLPEDMAALRKWGTEAEAIYAAGFDKLRMFRSQSEGTPESWIFLGGGRTINRLPGNVLFVSPRPLGGSWLVAYGDGSCEGLSDSKIEGLRMLIRRNGAQP